MEGFDFIEGAFRQQYFNHDGDPISLAEWGTLVSIVEYKVVGSDIIDVCDGQVHVSTVWLGLDHSWGNGPPVIFETMIFGGAHDELQGRYCTYAQAVAGHAEAVALVRREAAVLGSLVQDSSSPHDPPSD